MTMARAIGGSAGSLISSIGKLFPGSDNALRLDTLGRTIGSAVYDFTYDKFSSKHISSEESLMYAADVTMDMAYAPLYYYYTASIGNIFLAAAINGLIDGAIDVFQNMTFFAS